MTPASMLRRAAALALALSPVIAAAQGGQVPPVGAKVSKGAPAVQAPAAATTTIAAGAKYAAGAMRRWFLGAGYRDLWTTPIRVPFLDLDTFAGGLKPLKAGGGMQTKSLRLVTKDGNEYVFRCVQKDHSFSVPDRFKGSFIERGSRDLVSTGHPAGALVAAPLLEAAGVLHATPVLVVMPKDADLGEFSKDFAGQLGILEPYPHKPDKGEGFAGAAQIIDSEELLKKLDDEPTQRVDAPAFLAARLMDMLLGDWDRHPGQWKWARMEAGSHGAWVPIARDRDMAFATYEGVVGKVGGLFSPVAVPFSGSSVNIGALTWNSLELDRRLLGGLERPVWDSVTTDVTRRITDEVIDAAVRALPSEYRASAPRLAAALKERRARLGGVAKAFYTLVFHVADIHATDAAERATITRAGDGIVDVRVESGDGTPVFIRRFDARETKEIRLYLHGGDDTAVVIGNVRRSIPVRIVGGNGTNRLADSSTVDGAHNRAHLYDAGTVHGVSYGKDTLFNRQHWENEHGKLEPPGRDRGHSFAPSAGFTAELGLGITPRLGLTRYDYGFERRPYASSVSLEAAYAVDAGGFRITASADQRLERTPVHFTELARVSRLEVINYFGLGNATADSGPNSRYFAARQRQILFHPAIAIALGPRSDLSLGPIVQYSTTDSTSGRFLSADKPYGFGKFGQAGIQLNLHQDLQERVTDPKQRFVVDLNGTYFPAVWDVTHAFESVSFTVGGMLSLPVPMHPMLAFLAGGKKVFGTFPFHESAFIGGIHTSQYMEGQRYAGDASVYGSTELRIPVTTMSFVFPLDVGVVGIAEGGRVYVRGESPGGWHSIVGGGFWFSLREDHMHVVTITMSNQSGHRGVRLTTGLSF